MTRKPKNSRVLHEIHFTKDGVRFVYRTVQFGEVVEETAEEFADVDLALYRLHMATLPHNCDVIPTLANFMVRSEINPPDDLAEKYTRQLLFLLECTPHPEMPDWMRKAYERIRKARNEAEKERSNLFDELKAVIEFIKECDRQGWKVNLFLDGGDYKNYWRLNVGIPEDDDRRRAASFYDFLSKWCKANSIPDYAFNAHPVPPEDVTAPVIVEAL